jgi:hypothetical protein
LCERWPPIDTLEAILAACSPEERAALVRQARDECWRRGDLRWKLDANQRGLYEAIRGNPRKRFVLECARRLGKSYLLCVMAMEACLRQPRARVVYGAPTIKEVAEIIAPIIDDIAADAPADCRPAFNSQTGHVEFPNGASVVLFGCDDKRRANRGRGPGADFVVIDEAGFIPILAYVLHSIVNPQTLTTGGRVLIASTPSDEPDHDFTRIAEQAEADGNYAHRVITDNPRLTVEQIDEYVANEARDLGMTVEEYRASDTYQREHLARRVVDKTLVVMGEDWSHAKDAALVEVARPQFFDAYATLDMGGVDPHAVLFGYWHFENSWLVIEDELLFRDGCSTDVLAAAIKDKERQLWGANRWEGTLKALHEERADPALLSVMPDWLREKVRASEEAPGQPYVRICDNDIQIARDLSIQHGVSFIPTQKTDKRWYVNEFRILVRQGRLKVNPRCRNLDRHLRQTVWANHRMADYKRKNGEHGDLLDCVVYLCRNLRKQRNPVPPGFGVDPSVVHIRRPAPPNPLKQALGLTKRR